MQRYRVNYVLLAILAVGSIAFAALSYGAWSYQVNNNANKLLVRADRFESEGDLVKARENLEQYLKLRDEDEDVLLRLANLADDITKQDQSTPDDHRKAFKILSDASKKTDDPAIRRKWVEIQLKFSRPTDALKSLEQLIADVPDDPELQHLKALCLYRSKSYEKMLKQGYEMIGYNRATEEFDADKATAPGEIDTYALLSSHLSTLEDSEELTQRIIEQMVVANPDNYKSHLTHYDAIRRKLSKARKRGEREIETLESAVLKAPSENQKEAIREEIEEKQAEIDAEIEAIEEQAQESLNKAYELGPEEPEVLLAKGLSASSEEQYDEALEFYRKGVAAGDNSSPFEHRIALTLLAQEKNEEAKDYLYEVQKEKGVVLQSYYTAKLLAELLLIDGETEKLDKQLDELNRGKHPIFESVADYFRARQAQAAGDYKEAIKLYQQVRPKLTVDKDLQLKAGLLQAQCHQLLAENDLALDVLKSLEQVFPGNELVAKNLTDLRNRMGADGVRGPAQELQALIDAQLARDDSEQEWASVQQFIDALVDRKIATEAQKHLYEAQVAAARKRWQEAQDRIRDAYAKDDQDVNIHYSVARLLKIMPGKGPAVALKSLDKTVRKFGDTPSSRIMRADLLAALFRETRDDKVADEIRSVTEKMGDWNDRQKAMIWESVGREYRSLSMLDEAWRATLEAVKLSPSTVTLYETLFEIGAQDRNDARMEEAQELLLKYLGDKQDPAYLALSARRIMAGVSMGGLAASELDKAREMIEQALVKRPSWSKLHVLKGQLALQGSGDSRDIGEAIESFRKAFENARPQPQVVAILVKLLAKQRQYDEAYRQMQAIPLVTRTLLLNRTEADILRNVGQAEAAYESAESLAKQAPDDANVQLWFADMANNANNLDAAIEAANRAVELQPASLNAWNALVTIYLQRKEPDEVERTLRRAQLALDASFIPELTAQYYLRVGKWARAENIKLADWESGPKDSRAARDMANFYLIWDVNKPGSPEIIEKSKPFINHILNEAYDGKIRFDSDDAQWALRKAATMMARTADYRDSVKAEKLLTTAYEAAQEKEVMANLLADVLAVRRDPSSWLRAVEIFQDLKKRVGLQKASDVRLARLLFQVGEWDACKEQMEELLARYSDDVKVRVMYLAMLIEKGEFKEADRYLTGIQELDPDGKLTGELRIQLAAARGDKKETRRLLEGLTPRGRELTKETLPRLLTVAKIAIAAKDYEYAEQLYATFLKYQQNNAQVRLELAKLQAMHLDAVRGLNGLKPFFRDNIDSILQTSVAALRARKPEYGDKLDEIVEQRVKSALRDDPEAATRLLAQAETFEIQENYDRAISAYETMLKRDDLPMTVRASATNNLAYLYALSGQQNDKALELVGQAIELLGPLSDILDTRGVIYIAGGDANQAVEDMRMAVRIGETASKYFHLAQAELLAGNKDEAIAAWKRGEALGLEASEVTPLEQEGYEEAKQKIEALESGDGNL